MKRKSLKNQLIKIVAIAFIPVALLSCSEEEDSVEKDEKFCKCLEATAEMDAKSSVLMDGDISMEQAIEVQKLGKAVKEACKDYAEISQEKGLKLKKQCENK